MPKNQPMPIINQPQIYQTHKWLLSNLNPHVFCARCMLVPCLKCEKWIKFGASTRISHILLIVNKPPHLTIQSGTSSLSGPVTSVANTVTGIMVVYTRPIQSFQRHLPSLWAHTTSVANNQFSAGEPSQDMKFVKKLTRVNFFGKKFTH